MYVVGWVYGVGRWVWAWLRMGARMGWEALWVGDGVGGHRLVSSVCGMGLDMSLGWEALWLGDGVGGH